MKRKPKAYRRSVRKQQVIKQLMIWRENGYAIEATSYRLAKALEMNASPHFIDILNELVEEGALKAEIREQPGRYPTKFYSLGDAHIITSKFSRRHISVKSRGVAVGQLEMFS